MTEITAASAEQSKGIEGVNGVVSQMDEMTQQNAARVEEAGAERRHFEAKVFGGASVLRGFGTNNVGKRNAEFVLDYLHTEGIPVVAQDLLDTYPRKVYFSPVQAR